MARRDIVVLGGSMGSGAVLRQILGDLPKDFPASLFITTHMPSQEQSLLADMLGQASTLPVRRATEGQPIEAGHVYVAAPDRHLLLGPGALHLGDGPRENLARPAIDAMFRSAALTYGARVVGVVLTGLLNDGAAGLHAIKQRGGLAVVQHPLDAVAEDMPRAALETVEADEVARADEIAARLVELVRTEGQGDGPPPEELVFEVEVAAGANGGAQALAAEREGVEEAIIVAMRVMEERLELVQRMARDARASGRRAVAELYEKRSAEYQGYARTLRKAAFHRMPGVSGEEST